jgi:hypothetical protein
VSNNRLTCKLGFSEGYKLGCELTEGFELGCVLGLELTEGFELCCVLGLSEVLELGFKLSEGLELGDSVLLITVLISIPIVTLPVLSQSL